MMSPLREVVLIQESYKRLVRSKALSKKALCELCIPFRDKYGLADLQVLRIVRNEMDLKEMLDLLQPEEED